MRRQAVTRPAGSNPSPDSAPAVSRTSSAWSAPDDRATYLSRSMGCTGRSYRRRIFGPQRPSPLPSSAVATDPPADLTLTPLKGEGRTVGQWLTVFHLVTVAVDPYTNESAWVLEVAARILREFRDAAVRVSWLVTADAADARAFLGPLADEFLTFTDPDRTAVKALGL